MKFEIKKTKEIDYETAFLLLALFNVIFSVFCLFIFLFIYDNLILAMSVFLIFWFSAIGSQNLSKYRFKIYK